MLEMYKMNLNNTKKLAIRPKPQTESAICTISRSKAVYRFDAEKH
jgi:hypothetical protein